MSLAGGYVKAFFSHGLHRAVSALLDGNAHVHIEEPMKASASAGHESVMERGAISSGSSIGIRPSI
jgi:hypothetical protein